MTDCAAFPWSGDKKFVPAGAHPVTLVETRQPEMNGKKLKVLRLVADAPPGGPQPPQASEPLEIQLEEVPAPAEPVAAPAKEPDLGLDRETFLKRIEDLMGQGVKIRELEEENRALARTIARLQGEVDRLKAGAR